MMFGELGPAGRIHKPGAALVKSANAKQKPHDNTGEDRKVDGNEPPNDECSSLTPDVGVETVAKKTVIEAHGTETPQSITTRNGGNKAAAPPSGGRAGGGKHAREDRAKIRSLWGGKSVIKFINSPAGTATGTGQGGSYGDLRSCRVKSLHADSHRSSALRSVIGSRDDCSEDSKVSGFCDQIGEGEDDTCSTLSQISSCLLSISNIDRNSAVILDNSESDEQSPLNRLYSASDGDKTPECDLLDIFCNTADSRTASLCRNSSRSITMDEDDFKSQKAEIVDSIDIDSELLGSKNQAVDFEELPAVELNESSTSPRPTPHTEDFANDVNQSTDGTDMSEAPLRPSDDQSLESSPLSPEVGSSAVLRHQSLRLNTPPNIVTTMLYKRDHSLAYNTDLETDLSSRQSTDATTARAQRRENVLKNRRTTTPDCRIPLNTSPATASNSESCSKCQRYSQCDFSSCSSRPGSLSPCRYPCKCSLHSDLRDHGSFPEDNEPTSKPPAEHSLAEKPADIPALITEGLPQDSSTPVPSDGSFFTPGNKPLYLDTASVGISRQAPLSAADQTFQTATASTPVSADSSGSILVTAGSSKRSRSVDSLLSGTKRPKDVIVSSKSASNLRVVPSSRDESLQKILTPVLIPDGAETRVSPTSDSGSASSATSRDQLPIASDPSECHPVGLRGSSSLNDSSTTFIRNIDALNPEQYLIDVHKSVERTCLQSLSLSLKQNIRCTVEESVSVLRSDRETRNAKVYLDPSRLSYAMSIIENIGIIKKEDRHACCIIAVNAIKKLALAGNPNAQYFLGNIYMSGISYPSNNRILKPSPQKGFNFYVSASKQMHPEASFHLGLCYEEGMGTQKSYVRALVNYKKAAMLNHPGAMFRLGMCLINGEMRQSKQPREGVKWLKLAVKYSTEKYPHALYQLAMLHEKGLSNVVWVDHSYLIQLLSKAASLNHVQSQYLLGETYEYGNYGIDPDPGKSVYYYSLAAANGSSEAMFELGGWYLTGVYDQKTNFSIPQSDKQALGWIKLSAMANLPKGMYTLGYFYELGIGCSTNLDKSRYWYSAAAKNGDARAKRRVEANLNFDAGKKRTINPRVSSAAVRNSLFTKPYHYDPSGAQASSDFEKRMFNEVEGGSSSDGKLASLTDKTDSTNLGYSDSNSKNTSSSMLSSGAGSSKVGVLKSGRKTGRILRSPVPVQATPSPPLTESAVGDFSVPSNSSSPANGTRTSVGSFPQNSNSRDAPRLLNQQQHLIMISPKSDTKYAAPSYPTLNSTSESNSINRIDEFLNNPPCYNPRKVSFKTWNNRRKGLNHPPPYPDSDQQCGKKSQTCAVS